MKPVHVRVHVYEDLVSRSGHRELTLTVGGGDGPSGADLVETIRDELGSRGEAYAGTLALLRNGKVVDAGELAGVDVDERDEFHAARRPGEPTTIGMLVVAVFAAVASYALTPKPPRLTGSDEPAEKRFGFQRYSNEARVGDVKIVPMGRQRKFGGKVIARIPVESSNGDGDSKNRMLICLAPQRVESIGNQTADFDGVEGGSATVLEGIEFNDQPVSSFTGVRVWGRMGTAGQAVIPGFGDVETLREIGVGGVELRNTSGSERTGGSASGEAFLFTTGDPVNAVVPRVLFTNGLFTVAGSGQVDTRRAKYRYRTRVSAGPGAWSGWTVIDIEQARQSEFFSSPRIDGLATGAGDVMDVQLERVSVEPATVSDVDKMVWHSLVEVVYSSRTYPNHAMLALEVTANEQLQGVPQVSVDLEGCRLRVWDGVSPASAPVFAVAYTENPAWMALEVLTNTTWGLGATYGDGRIDMESLFAWAEHCDELVPRADGSGDRPRYRCHLLLDRMADGIDWLRTICRTGRCTPVCSGGVWRFIVGRVQASPVEVFTDATIAVDEQGVAQFEYTRELTTGGLTRANRLVCQFENELQSGHPDVIAFPELGELWLGGGTPEPPREEAIRLDGVTDPDQVYTELVYMLKVLRFLSRSVAFQTTKQLVMVQPGDRFDLAMSLPGWGLASGRCAAGGSTTLVRLDKSITLEPATAYTVRVVHASGAMEVRAVTAPAGSYDAGMAIAVATLAAAAAEFDEYSIGPAELEVKPFTCTGVALLDATNLRWEVRGVEYAEGVYDPTPGGVTIPTYSTLPGGSSPPGPVRDLRAFERTVNGIHHVQLSWTQSPADAEITSSFRVYRRRIGTTTWVLIPEPHIAFRSAVIEIGDTGTAYEFCVVAVSYGGAFLSPYDPRVPIVSLVFGLGVEPPPPPTTVSSTNTGGNTYTLFWDPVEDAVAYQVISMGISPGGTSDGHEHSMIVARTIDPELTGLELAPSQTVTFWVRSVGSNGRLSFTATGHQITAATPGGETIKATTTLNDASAATPTNCSWVTVGSEEWLRTTVPGTPAVIEFDEVDPGSLTLTELTILPSTRNDHGDPTLNSDPFKIPSIAADQWGIVSVGPPVIGMLMPPWPDNEQAWLFEVRTHDGGSYGAWEGITIGTSIKRTFQKWQLRATMTRAHAPYLPSLERVVVVLTH